MQYVGRVFSTVSQYYKEINPATLSGAIDIVVVKHSDGELACSPFHVRFGKLRVLRPSEKKVEITVNGEIVNFPMKVGDAGEAFFVFETDQNVPEELQTSPIASPADASVVVEEPDFLDLSATPNKVYGLEDGYVSADSDSDTESKKRPGHDEPIIHGHDKETSLSDTEIDMSRRLDKPKHHGGYTSDGEFDEETEAIEEWSWGWGRFPEKESHSRGVSISKGTAVQRAEAIEALNDICNLCELSLCGPSAIRNNEGLDIDMNIFDKNVISVNDIVKDPAILDNEELVIRYNDKYYDWAEFSMILSEIAASRKASSDGTLDSLAYDLSSTLNIKEEATDSTRRSWSRWWRRPSRRPTQADLNSERVVLEADQFSNSAIVVAKEADGKRFAKTLRLTSDQLKQLNLKPGPNNVTFSVTSSYSGMAACSAKIFLWNEDTKIVISDIDGTITKSDALGHVFAMIGRDWTHSGVAKLYTDIRKNGYQILYLTSRAIGQADYTRDYLKKVEQNKYQLPEGPVIMSPDRLMTALHREVIMRKPEVFKMACLRDIQKLFGDVSPFHAGFGNRITDALSYRSVSVPSSRIFTIDHNGDVKMELLELAGYKSSYIHMTDLVDHFFPPVGRKENEEYNDFNYWKDPLPTVEIPTPSPETSPRLRPASRASVIRSLAGTFTSRSRSGTVSSIQAIMLETSYSRSAPDLPNSPGLVDAEKVSTTSAPRDIVDTRQRKNGVYTVNGDVDMPGSLDERPAFLDDREEDYVSPDEGQMDDEGDILFTDNALADEDHLGDPEEMSLEEFAEHDPLARSLDLKSTPYL